MMTRNKSKHNDQSNDDAITVADLEEILSKHFEKQKEEFKVEIDRLKSDIVKTNDIAEAALDLARKNQDKIDLLESENNALRNKLNTIGDKQLNSIEERIEDRTNRQMRKSVIFKNIPESKAETWEETESVLAAHIQKIAGVPLETAAGYLERAHRGAPSKDQTGPRHIFAAFYDWKCSESVKEAFRNENINNNGKLYAEQKYGPMTTKRRNAAMVLRKDLKAQKKIISGYVAFPAKLMVRTEQGSKYKVFKDFSAMKVSFGK